LAEVNSSVLNLALNVPKELAALVLVEILLQRVGAETGNERDENALVVVLNCLLLILNASFCVLLT